MSATDAQEAEKDASAYGRTLEELCALPLPFRDDLFAGKRVLVSGAGSGIGQAIAVWFARMGARLILCGRRVDRLERTAAVLADRGAEVHLEAMNIRDPDAVAKLMDAAWDKLGGLDVLVNNAGGQFPQAAIDFSPNGWRAVIDTNLNGSWFMMQSAARRWRDDAAPGRIVNIVAVVGRGMPGVAHTCAARAGVIHLSKTLAVEWAPLNISVNCVAPGIIASEGMNAYSAEALAEMPKSNPMLKFGQVEDVANAVCHLAGPGGDFMTGEVVTLDGGGQMWGDLWTIPKPDYFA
jgi:citronellol/citronellal dehydrogenase